MFLISKPLPQQSSFDAVVNDRPLQDLGRITVFTRQNSVLGLDQEDFRAKLRKRLSHLAANGAGTDHAKRSGSSVSEKRVSFVR